MYLASILFRKHENKIKLTEVDVEVVFRSLPTERTSVHIISLLFTEVNLCCCTVFSKIHG